ncbi:MAG: hypothetical protein AVDCRST_MAG52-747, partial [uncultured Blastococcus sp.]
EHDQHRRRNRLAGHQEPREDQLRRPRQGDVDLPDRQGGRHQLRIRRHVRRGAPGDRIGRAPGGLAAQRHAAHHDHRERQPGM